MTSMVARVTYLPYLSYIPYLITLFLSRVVAPLLLLGNPLIT